jgi:hypothetical protein
MQTTATLNPILTAVANMFARDPKGFVADRIAPRFPAPLQSGTYYKFDIDDIANVPDLKARAPGAPYQRIQTKVTNDTYSCENYGLEAPAPDEERKKYAVYFDLDRVKTSRIVDTIRVNREKRVVALLASLPSANVVVPWNDPSSNPKADVDAACEVIRQQSGTSKAMITMTINNPTFLALQTHNKLVDLFKYTAAGVLNEDKLAGYFGVRRVVVAYNVQAINHEGQAFSASDILGNLAAFTTDVESVDLEVPCTLRTFIWTAFNDQITTLDSGGPATVGNGGAGAADTHSIFTYRDETVKADIHRGDHYLAEKIVASGTGYCLNNCLG